MANHGMANGHDGWLINQSCDPADGVEPGHEDHAVSCLLCVFICGYRTNTRSRKGYEDGSCSITNYSKNCNMI
ncbi:hypothetical protein NQ315_010958, partial [Exocentrus adspersus]